MVAVSASVGPRAVPAGAEVNAARAFAADARAASWSAAAWANMYGSHCMAAT